MTANNWADLVAGLQAAGEHLDRSTRELDPVEQVDAYRALLRALNNLLNRVEGDPAVPELTPFNGWRQKFFMDNPDYRYWITDIGDGDYRISGNVGNSVYQSLTAYRGKGIADAAAVARVDSDDLQVDAAGNFAITLSRTAPASGPWLETPDGTSSVWVRYVLPGGRSVDPGACQVERLGRPGPPGPADPAKFLRDLTRLGGFIGHLPQVFEMAVGADLAAPNSVRHWSAMSGGAAFTEPGIHYLRGNWQLGTGDALLVEGPLVACRHWNIVLYSRFLNSLDYRRRVVSRTAETSSVRDGRFRFVLAAQDPHLDGYDWLDTEGRPFGLFVLRFLLPQGEPELPAVRRIPSTELGCAT